jgi:hypothetical protein
MDQNRYYMDGPGETLIMTTDFDPSAATPNVNKIIAIVTTKSATLTDTPSFEKVTGGRSLAPRRKFITDRETTFEITDCEMDFRYVSLSQGEDEVVGATTAWAFGDDYKFTIATTVTLPVTPINNTLVVVDQDGKAMVKSATPSAGQYNVSGAQLFFHSGDVGKAAYPIFQYNTPSTTRVVSTKSTSVPRTVKIVHRQAAFDKDNNLIGYEEIEIFKAQVSSQFEQAYAERTPFAPTLTFELIDPDRPDKKLFDYKFIPVSQ